MTDENSNTPGGNDNGNKERDSFHAKRRRARRDKLNERRDRAMGKAGSKERDRRPTQAGTYEEGPCVYGLHTVRAALQNSDRQLTRLLATQNAVMRLSDGAEEWPYAVPVDITSPSKLDKLVGSDAVHQGAVLLLEPVEPKPFDTLATHKTILALDQVTDPHNVGAIMRSAVALGCGALLTTSRHSAAQTGVLAKSASGGLDMIDFVEVTNLSNAIEDLHAMGFSSIGLDSEGPADMTNTLASIAPDAPLLIVMGSEGKGLRQKTRETVNTLARLDMPGEIKSLNVSNATAIALFCVDQLRKKAD